MKKHKNTNPLIQVYKKGILTYLPAQFKWQRLYKQTLLFEADKLNQTNKYLFFANLGLIIVSVFLILFFYLVLPPVVPLFYSAPWGEAQLASKDFLFIIPFLMLVITSIALMISRQLAFADEVIIRSLFGSGLLFNLILFITLIKIIWLII
ncbi:MAG: hypothetical protein GXP43_01990 [bacterium]|nr:hypothetical protein [bacterium]